MSDNFVTNEPNKHNHNELNYNLYPSLQDKNDINLLEDKIDDDNNNTKTETPLQLKESTFLSRKLSQSSLDENSLVDFFYQISNPECQIPKPEIILTMSKFLKNSNLITQLTQDNYGKKYTLSSLCTICAKRLTYNCYNKGDILFRQGNDNNKLYLVLTGRLSVLKIKEANNCLMTYQEYFDYLWYLHKHKEEYILNELFRKNYYLFQVSNYTEFLKVYHIYFSIILNNKLTSNEFHSIEDIQQFFIKHHKTLNEYDLNENTIENILSNNKDLISYISNKTKQSLEDSIYFDQFKYLLIVNTKQLFTTFIYKHLHYYTYNDLIGNFPLELNQQYNITVRCETECILASMTCKDYLNMIVSKNQDIKQKDILFLSENFFFKDININIFEKNYFNYFVLDSCNRNYILYEEGAKLHELILLKEGSIQLEITCSVVDIHNLVKFIYQKILSITHYLDIPINNNQLLTKSQLFQLKQYINDPELAGLKLQNETFVREMFKVKTFDLSIISGKISLGIEELFLNLPYLSTAKVISHKATFMKIDKDKLNEIVKTEKTCLNLLVKLTIQKIISLLERLHHIKRNTIEYALHNTKKEEKIERKNYNSIEINNLNKVNLTPKVNQMKIDMMLLSPSQREYKNVHSTRNNSVRSLFKNKTNIKTISINQDNKQKQIIENSSENFGIDKQNSLFKLFSQTNEMKYNKINNDNNKILASLKKNTLNENNDKLLINFGHNYISLTNLEKELLHYNVRKISNTSSQISFAENDNTLLSNNDTDSKNHYREQILNNLLFQNGHIKHGSYSNLTQLYRLNYIPLNLNRISHSIDTDKKRDGRIHLDKLRFLSQLKKYRKKYGSASVDNLDSIKVIDSTQIPEKKIIEKGKPSMMLPSVVKDFYKKIQLKGYSGLVSGRHTYLKKKIFSERDKEPFDKKIMKLSNIFSTEMNKLKENIMSKGTSFYLTHKQSSNS